jgi:sigma-B regulation protein RsbU (phosphoserine phosphatase)
MKRGLSIKYKILLVLTLVPVITLALYLFLAIKVFENDKLAYVFENGSAMSRTLSSQSTTDLNSVLINAKPMIQEFLLQRDFGKVTRAVLDPDGKIDWIAAFGISPEGKYEKLAIAEKLAGMGLRDLQSFGNIDPLLNLLKTTNRLIRIPFKDDRVLIIEKVQGAVEGGEQDTKLFLLMSRLPDLAAAFRAPGAAELFLVNDQGLILFGPSGTEATYLTTKFPLNFLTESKAQGLASGTEQIKSTVGKSLLASFSRVNFGDLAVVTVMDKSEALRAVDVLLIRSLVFFVMIISVSTIVSLFASGSLTSALTDLFTATKQVAEGDFAIRVKVRSNDEIGSLGDSFNAMAGEVSRLMGETAEKARMESELKTAQTVQETLFPPTVADLGGIRIAGHYEPASECGGDWWHYSKVENKVWLWIGDATGHGAPAALITSAAKSAATIIERLNVDPSHALKLLNRAIYDVSKGQIMMTFFLASYDLETKKLTYANASHEGPYLFKKKEGAIKKKDLVPLNDVNNPRLGQARETEYEQITVDLEIGDRILFYTDGIPDIEDPQKNAWGEREFIKGIISSNADFPPVEEAVKTFVNLFSAYRQNSPLKDDITFFMFEVVS